jgi:hypothetical protein
LITGGGDQLAADPEALLQTTAEVRSASERAGLSQLRPWRAALTDYMERAGLLAGVAV